MSRIKSISSSTFLVGCLALACLLNADGQVAAQTRSLGLDISAWQGNISQTTWNNIHNVENRDFVILRASRGGTTGYYNQSNADNDPPTNTFSQRYDDPYFVQNINRATAAGMYAGSYHFSRPDIIETTLNSNGIANTGADEADHFIQMAGPWMRPGYLWPVHDFEAGDGVRTDDEMAQFAIDFSDRIYEVMDIRPAIYTSGNYAHNILGGASQALRNELAQPSGTNPNFVSPAYTALWSARWPNQGDPDSIDVQNGNPTIGFANIYGPWDDYGVTHPWTFWQYASTGRLQSYNNGNSNLDFDVARGGEEFLRDQLVPALWVSEESGDWSELANWNSGQTPIAPVQGPGQVPRVGPLTMPTPRLPGAAGSGVTSGQHDTVLLDRPEEDITVTLSSGTHNIRKLYAREALDITGGSLTINYTPSWDSTPNSAQFSAPVSLSGGASLSVHTLQVDNTRTFTLGDGSVTLNKINLMPHASSPAKMVFTGDVNFSPLNNAAAVIAKGSGAGSSGYIDLGGGNRRFSVADGSAATDLAISVPIINGGITKSGPGTLHLTANNAYDGDTAVEAGTLRINSAFLSNSGDVLLSTGSVLNLNFGGSPDVIDSLFIDGVAQPVGIWGGEGSGAPFTTPLITGNGRLSVMTTVIVPTIPGDFDADGDVDGDDLAKWQGDVGMGDGSDADEDGDTDGRDFLIWQRNYTGPQALTSSSVAVPEPGTVTLLVVALVLATNARRR